VLCDQYSCIPAHNCPPVYIFESLFSPLNAAVL